MHTQAVARLIAAIVLLAAVWLVSSSAPYPDSLHPDWTEQDPISWRLPLDAGNYTALYLVGGKLLLQYSDQRALIVSLDGEIEQAFAAPYDLRMWTEEGKSAILRDDGVIISLKEIAPEQEYADFKPTDYELLEMDIMGNVLERYPLKADLGPLNLVAAGGGLILLTDGFDYNSEDDTGTSIMLAMGDGEMLWKRDLPQYGLISSAVLADGTFIYNDSESLYGVSSTGEEVWSYADENCEEASIVALDGKSALVTLGYNSDTLFQFDASGLVWSQAGFQDLYVSAGPWGNCIQLTNDSTVINGYPVGLILIDSAGNHEWSRLTEYRASYIMAGTGGTFYFSDYDAGLCAMDSNGQYLWLEPRLQSPEGNFVLDREGHLYSINGNELYCIDTAAYIPRDPVANDPLITYYAAHEKGHVRWQVPAATYISGDYPRWMDPPKVDEEGYIYFQDNRAGGLQILTPEGETYTNVYECGASYGEFTVRPGGGLFLVVDEFDWYSPDNKLLLSELGCADRDGNPLFKNDVMEFGRMSELEIHGDALYSLGASITCFDLDGMSRWSVSAGEDCMAQEMCPMPGGGIAVRLDCKGSEQALLLDAQGEELARFDLTGDSLGPAATIDGALVFHMAGVMIYAVDQAGTRLWEYKYTPMLESIGRWSCGSPIANGDVVYAGTGDGRLIAFSSTGDLLWEYQAGSIVSTPAIGADGTIYASALQKAVFALNPAGEELWRLSGLGFIVSPPVLGIDGSVLVLSENALLALEP